MTALSDFLHSELIFWAAWVIIPVLMEFIPSIGNVFVLLKRWRDEKNKEHTDFKPQITVIIPVYNSASTLYACIKSVYDSDYPKDKINVILANNQTKDNCFEIFNEAQVEFPDMPMSWINAQQGKSKALNLAIFNSKGIYVIHIDSDGVLEPNALRNMVDYFETNPDVHCVTGTVLTNPEMIDKTKGFFLRLLRKMEFGEYCQAFLSGRNFQTEMNSMFTVSGAFSGFRRSALMKTQLYNFDTLCEDTHVTFQLRDHMNKRVALCSDAIFFVDPIDDLNKLYVQRQRWQIGELEVMHMFRDDKKIKLGKGFLKDFVIRLVVFDHTFAFPRMIWYFALMALALISYPLKLIVVSAILLFLIYSISNLFLYLCINMFLRDFKDIKRYYARKWYLIILLPFFNFITFWFRFAGIINSIYIEQRVWTTKNFKQEFKEIRGIIARDFETVGSAIRKIRKAVNKSGEAS